MHHQALGIPEGPVLVDRIPRQDIALGALVQIRATLDEADGIDWSRDRLVEEVDHILRVAYARLRMTPVHRRGRTWLAKVASYCWPSKIKRPDGNGNAPFLTFIVEVADGAKSAIGRKVEVQMPIADAARFAKQMTGMVEHFGEQAGEECTGVEVNQLMPVKVKG